MVLDGLMEEVCERENLKRALKRVKQNKGAAGVDGMSVQALPEHLRTHWPDIREALMQGKYKPQPTRRVEIPKDDGKGIRLLSIPCVLDRFIQQAVLQVLQRYFDREFSDSSYGFRPGRSQHQAIAKAQDYIVAGYEFVVDLDLEKFFDRVNHDILMGRLSKMIGDKSLLTLIRSMLNAGACVNGLTEPTDEGTPQGGPLSPFLSNVMLDVLDKELENRGHKFVRFADDCNIYVKSERSGQRVMNSVTRFLTQRLNLKVNLAKSAVARPSERKFLGFTFFQARHELKRRIAPKALDRFRDKIRVLTNRLRGNNLAKVVADLREYMLGWRNYFGFSQMPSVLEELDGWVRRRIRRYLWKQWKTPARRRQMLIKLGVPKKTAAQTAWSSKGPWRMAGSPGVAWALSIKYFDSLGLPRLAPSKNV